MVIPVVNGKVKDRPRKHLHYRLMVASQDAGHFQKIRIVTTRNAVIGMNEVAEGVDVNAPMMLAVKTLDSEKTLTILTFKQP